MQLLCDGIRLLPKVALFDDQSSDAALTKQSANLLRAVGLCVNNAVRGNSGTKRKVGKGIAGQIGIGGPDPVRDDTLGEGSQCPGAKHRRVRIEQILPDGSGGRVRRVIGGFE